LTPHPYSIQRKEIAVTKNKTKTLQSLLLIYTQHAECGKIMKYTNSGEVRPILKRKHTFRRRASDESIVE
jgi:hypothetical protein